MLRRVALFLVLVLGAAGVAASATREADSAAQRANASRLMVGFMDDAQIYGNPTWSFTQLRALRAGIVRVTLDWGAVARRRPARPADPADPAYNWTAVDNIVTLASRNGVRVLLAVYGTPRWAGRARNRIPRRI